MGFILPEIYKSICLDNNIDMPKTFIETGTFKGGVPHRVLETYKQLDDCFESYYTIELGTDICKVASMRYKYFEQGVFDHDKIHTDELDSDFQNQCTYFNNKLTLINNDSVKALSELLPNINTRICFWLDAHAGAQKYARGNVDVPLLQELDVIKQHPIKDHIIAIDDAHLFGELQTDRSGTVTCDYRDVTFERIREKILEINPKYDVGIYAPYDMKMLIAFVA